jgi:hypothetical protein
MILLIVWYWCDTLSLAVGKEITGNLKVPEHKGRIKALGVMEN